MAPEKHPSLSIQSTGLKFHVLVVHARQSGFGTAPVKEVCGFAALDGIVPPLNAICIIVSGLKSCR